MELLVGVQDKKEYVKTLVDALLSAAASLESGQYKRLHVCTLIHEWTLDVPFQDSALFMVEIVSISERCAGEQDGYFLDVNITNKLPCVSCLCSIRK